jgi:hypothetical protein
VGKHRLDLLVEGEIVIDLKAISELLDVHFAIVKSQLRAMKRKHGLLLNFAKVKLEAKRVSPNEGSRSFNHETRKPRNGNCTPKKPVRNLLLSWPPYKKTSLIMKPGDHESETERRTNRFGRQEPFCFCAFKISCFPGLLIKKSAL